MWFLLMSLPIIRVSNMYLPQRSVIYAEKMAIVVER